MMTIKPKSDLIHDELSEEPEPLLLPGKVRPVPLEDGVLLHPGEQDLDAVRPVVAERDACQKPAFLGTSMLPLGLNCTQFLL